jgi:hypothetical protein
MPGIIGPMLPKITEDGGKRIRAVRSAGPGHDAQIFGTSRSRDTALTVLRSGTDVLSHVLSVAYCQGISPRALMDIISPRVSGILPLFAGLSKVRNYEATWTGVVKL